MNKADHIVATKDDTIAIMVGTNDARHNTPPETACRNMKTAIEKIKKNNPETTIAIIQPPPMDIQDITATYAIVRYSYHLETIAHQTNTLFIPTEETIIMGNSALHTDG